jgi:hypothetical protein
MFMQNFNSLAITQTDLDKFLTIFQVNFSKFQIQYFPIRKKIQKEYCETHLLPKFKISKVLLIFFDSWVWSRNFKISKFNPAQLTKGSRNLKSVALKTAEIQIQYKFRPTTGRQRRVTDGYFFFALNSFSMYKKS